MKWIEVKVKFKSKNYVLAEELIADIFYNFNLKGLVFEDPKLKSDEEWDEYSIDKPNHHSVAGYFPKNDLSNEKISQLEKELIKLEKTDKIKWEIFYKEIDEENWAEFWKEYFYPEKISKQIIVKPTWREYTPENNEIIIQIDPGMAFGMGTHPTTSLCVQMIEKYIKPGACVLDIGTGTGILLIAAKKLGANKLYGVDIDQIAVDIAKNNLILNNISNSQFNIRQGDLTHNINEKFDFVISNILSEIIINLMDSIKNVMNPSAIVIVSGISEKKHNQVIEKMKQTEFEIIDIMTKDQWVTIAGKLMASTKNQSTISTTQDAGTSSTVL